MALDFLTNGGPAVNSGDSATQTTLPDWYNRYIQGIASKATDIAATPYQNYPGQQLADFNDDQRKAFDTVRANQGSYKPALDAATGMISGAQGGLQQAAQYGANATGAVAGPAQSWIDPGVADKYMSPYTKNVTDEIARLGNQNLMQQVIPGVMSNFVGSGQFGSTRNADILGQNVRDAQTNISGLQSTALQNGYNSGAGIFANDANRQQQQGQLQANTNLSAGQLATTGASVGTQAGTAMGGLGQLRQTLGNNDATSLGAIGGQQQQLEQTGYDLSKQNFQNQQNWDWTQLGKVQGAVQGAQLPTGSTTSANQSTSSAGTSPLAWVTALGGLYNAINP
jgi:hypothetical protein